MSKSNYRCAGQRAAYNQYLNNLGRFWSGNACRGNSYRYCCYPANWPDYTDEDTVLENGNCVSCTTSNNCSNNCNCCTNGCCSDNCTGNCNCCADGCCSDNCADGCNCCDNGCSNGCACNCGCGCGGWHYCCRYGCWMWGCPLYGGTGYGYNGADAAQTACLQENAPLAMAYVPRQGWEYPADAQTAMNSGTIFPSLVKPFYGGRA